MIAQQGVDSLAREARLDGAANWLQGVVKRIYRDAGRTGQGVADALYGTWAGHPLHPALTDFPIGAWSVATILDLADAVTGSRGLSLCADSAVAIGVAGGTAAILAGFTDWQHTSREPKRIGLVHSILNVGVTVAEAASLALRAVGLRRAGRVVSGVAYGSLLVSAYLGGEMIEKYRIGVNRASQEAVPAGFVAVLAESELQENQPRQVDLNGSPVLLVRRGDRIYAMHAICTHLGGPLPQGMLVDDTIQCPWHGSRFALSDGHVVHGPASFPEQCLATQVRNGQIEVGPGAGLGRCRHEPIPVAVAVQAQEMAAVPAH